MLARRILVVLGVVVVLVAGFLAYRMLPEAGPDDGTQLSPTLRRALGDRVVQVLELDRSARRPVLDTADQIVCAARVFGSEPLAVKSADEVSAAFARILCVQVQPDGTAGERVHAPISVQLRPSVLVRCPRDGAAYADDLDRIFPERLHDVVRRDDPRYGELRDEVERRLLELTTQGSPATR